MIWSVKPHLSEFIAYLRSEKGAADNTIQAYERDLRLFLTQAEPPFCHEKIIAHLAMLKAKGYATSSIARSLMAIKVFCRFLCREGVLSKNIALVVDSPKLWQRIPDVLTIEEVAELLETLEATTFDDARDRAILELLYGSGLRVSELCQLSLYSVDDRSVKVLGKGAKERVVPIGSMAIDALDRYLNWRGHFDSPLLFLTYKGRPIDRFFVWKMVKRCAKRAGILKTVSPHTLRHCFATHLLQMGAELRVIQELLGHANIATTDRYTHLMVDRIQESFKQFHPRN